MKRWKDWWCPKCSWGKEERDWLYYRHPELKCEEFQKAVVRATGLPADPGSAYLKEDLRHDTVIGLRVTCPRCSFWEAIDADDATEPLK